MKNSKWVHAVHVKAQCQEDLLMFNTTRNAQLTFKLDTDEDIEEEIERQLAALGSDSEDELEDEEAGKYLTARAETPKEDYDPLSTWNAFLEASNYRDKQIVALQEDISEIKEATKRIVVQPVPLAGAQSNQPVVATSDAAHPTPVPLTLEQLLQELQEQGDDEETKIERMRMEKDILDRKNAAALEEQKKIRDKELEEQRKHIERKQKEEEMRIAEEARRFAERLEAARKAREEAIRLERQREEERQRALQEKEEGRRIRLEQERLRIEREEKELKEQLEAKRVNELNRRKQEAEEAKKREAEEMKTQEAEQMKKLEAARVSQLATSNGVNQESNTRETTRAHKQEEMPRSKQNLPRTPSSKGVLQGELIIEMATQDTQSISKALTASNGTDMHADESSFPNTKFKPKQLIPPPKVLTPVRFSHRTAVSAFRTLIYSENVAVCTDVISRALERTLPPQRVVHENPGYHVMETGRQIWVDKKLPTIDKKARVTQSLVSDSGGYLGKSPSVPITAALIARHSPGTPLGEIKKLDLSFEGITEIVALEGCTSLHTLHLNTNRIECIPNKSLPQLVELSLKNNHLSRESALAGLQGQTRLSTLLVTANSLSSTSFTLAPFLPALRKLDGGSNNIDSALNICSKYTTLQELILDHNIITSVDGVEWCTQLLVLDIGSNKLKALGEELSALPLLDVFKGDGNQIEHFPQFGVLLREAWLNNNRISIFDPLVYLPHLQHLHLSHNNIHAIEWLAGCPLLQTLDLSYNKVAYLEDIRPLKFLNFLWSFNMVGNPVALHPAYKPLSIFFCPSISELDSSTVERDDQSLYSSSAHLFVHQYHRMLDAQRGNWSLRDIFNKALQETMQAANVLPRQWNFVTFVEMCISLVGDRSHIQARQNRSDLTELLHAHLKMLKYNDAGLQNRVKMFGRHAGVPVALSVQLQGAAIIIQALWRGYFCRKLLGISSRYSILHVTAAVYIQKCWRGYATRKGSIYWQKRKGRQAAATKIQAVFRGYLVRAVLRRARASARIVIADDGWDYRAIDVDQFLDFGSASNNLELKMPEDDIDIFLEQIPGNGATEGAILSNTTEIPPSGHTIGSLSSASGSDKNRGRPALIQVQHSGFTVSAGGNQNYMPASSFVYTDAGSANRTKVTTESTSSTTYIHENYSTRSPRHMGTGQISEDKNVMIPQKKHSGNVNCSAEKAENTTIPSQQAGARSLNPAEQNRIIVPAVDADKISEEGASTPVTGNEFLDEIANEWGFKDPRTLETIMKRDQKRSKSVKHIHSYSPSNRQSKSHGASPAVTPPHYSKEHAQDPRDVPLPTLTYRRRVVAAHSPVLVNNFFVGQPLPSISSSNPRSVSAPTTAVPQHQHPQKSTKTKPERTPHLPPISKPRI